MLVIFHVLLTFKLILVLSTDKSPQSSICLVKVINPNWINLICHGKASNQAGKKQHLLFQCKLNVLGLPETMLLSFILHKSYWQTFFLQCQVNFTSLIRGHNLHHAEVSELSCH